MADPLIEAVDAAVARLERVLASAPPDPGPPPDDPDGPFEGADGTGLIRVAVDRSGGVVGVTIDRFWSRCLPATGLADGLYTACRAAVALSMTARWYASRPPPSDRRPVPAPPPDDLDDDEWAAVMRARLYAIDERQERLERIPAAPPPDVRTATGGYGYLIARGEGGTVLGVTAAVDDLRAVPAARLSWEALSVLRAAQGLPHIPEPAASRTTAFQETAPEETVPREAPPPEEHGWGDDYGGWGGASDWNDPQAWQR